MEKYRRVNSKIFQGKFAYPKSNNKNNIHMYIFNRDINEERREGEREERKHKMKTMYQKDLLFVDVPFPLLLIYMWGIIEKTPPVLANGLLQQYNLIYLFYLMCESKTSYPLE